MIEIDDDKYPHQDIEDIKKGHWALSLIHI